LTQIDNLRTGRDAAGCPAASRWESGNYGRGKPKVVAGRVRRQTLVGCGYLLGLSARILFGQESIDFRTALRAGALCHGFTFSRLSDGAVFNLLFLATLDAVAFKVHCNTSLVDIKFYHCFFINVNEIGDFSINASRSGGKWKRFSQS
jgi:hypothetical protein